LIQEATDRWKEFRRTLRREDRPHFHPLFTPVRCYTPAETYQAHDNPMEAVLLPIALDTQRRLEAVEKVLQNARVLCEVAARMDFRPLPQSSGMTPWLIGRNQSHCPLGDSFAPAFLFRDWRIN